MLKKKLINNTLFVDSIDSWQKAIRIGAQPLVDQGVVEESYVDAIIQNVFDNGNYIILLPQVAMPHARPETGSNGVGITFLHVNQPVVFPGEEPVTVFFTLASDSPDGHLDLIASLGELLSDEELYQKLLKVTNEQELLTLISQV